MNRFYLAMSGCLLFLPLPTIAQDQAAENAAEQKLDQVPATQLEKAIEENIEQFEQLLLKRATDFDHPNHLVAVQLLSNRQKQYEELNEFVEGIFENGNFNQLGAKRSLTLISLSKLDKSKQVRFTLDILQQYEDLGVHGGQLLKKSNEILAQFPVETIDQITERLKKANAGKAMLELLNLISKNVPLEKLNEAMQPLLALAKSDSPEIAESAMNATSRLASEIDRRLREKRMALTKPVRPAGMDEKIFRYAERIIGRYDKNNDGFLTSNEYSTMLMTPKDADADKDGIITAVEYAVWLATKGRKSN